MNSSLSDKLTFKGKRKRESYFSALKRDAVLGTTLIIRSASMALCLRFYRVYQMFMRLMFHSNPLYPRKTCSYKIASYLISIPKPIIIKFDKNSKDIFSLKLSKTKSFSGTALILLFKSLVFL